MEDILNNWVLQIEITTLEKVLDTIEVDKP